MLTDPHPFELCTSPHLHPRGEHCGVMFDGRPCDEPREHSNHVMPVEIPDEPKEVAAA